MSLRQTVILSVLVILCYVARCECSEENLVESRGKKKKIALFVYFADLVVKKIFVLKVIYAIIFWIVLHKAGYFLAWFTSYIKDQKKHEHHHVPHYVYHDHDHDEPSYGAGWSGGHVDSYGPYRRNIKGA